MSKTKRSKGNLRKSKVCHRPRGMGSHLRKRFKQPLQSDPQEKSPEALHLDGTRGSVVKCPGSFKVSSRPNRPPNSNFSLCYWFDLYSAPPGRSLELQARVPDTHHAEWWRPIDQPVNDTKSAQSATLPHRHWRDRITQTYTQLHWPRNHTSTGGIAPR